MIDNQANKELTETEAAVIEGPVIEGSQSTTAGESTIDGSQSSTPDGPQIVLQPRQRLIEIDDDADATT